MLFNNKNKPPKNPYTTHDSGFDFIAPVYDMLASWVFGQSQQKAQLHFMDDIHPNASVLFIGGGSGWALRELLRRKPDLQKVVYIEASMNMLSLAQQKASFEPNRSVVDFVFGTEKDIPEEETFDAVITYFFLDIFSELRMADSVLPRLHKALRPNGRLLFADFRQSTQFKHKLLLKSMYLFFGVLSRIEGSRLPNFEYLFKKQSFVKTKSELFFSGMIEAAIYEKHV